MLLPVDGPLDLVRTLESGQAFRWRRQDEWFHGVLSGKLLLLRQVPRGLEFSCAPGQEAEAADLLRGYFRLGDNLPAIQRSLARDRVLGQAIERYPGLRLLRQEPWECLVSFICSSYANIPRIAGMVEALALRYGRPLEVQGVVRHAFPSPQALALAGEAGLRALGLGYRAPYLAQVARGVAGGLVKPDAIASLPYHQARKELLGLPGVGEKVADCVLLYGLGKLEAFPIDLWVRRALERWYGKKGRLSYRRLSQWAQRRFGPLAGYAQLYLFYAARWGARP